MRQLDTSILLDARPLAETILSAAVKQRASDIHVEPTAQGYDVRFRVDGNLLTHCSLPSADGRMLAGRLMVLAKLLTYRLDVPQEGRAMVVVSTAEQPLALRISSMPTTHGPRIAVRLPADSHQPFDLNDLHMPEWVVNGLKQFAASDLGLFIVTGPAGSGKTTTVYALLRHIVETSPGLSIVTLEDPVERDLPGVTQIEVTPFGDRTYERCLRSILRQDPQVLVLGEIRDAATASLAVQAALSGHRLICTLHAATAGGAISRLIEMGVEPYQLTSSLAGVVTQRLLRRLVSAGQYLGRLPVAELAIVDAELRAAILRRADREELDRAFASRKGAQSLRAAAEAMVRDGLTDLDEIKRVGLTA